MASTATIPRFLLPRADLFLRYNQAIHTNSRIYMRSLPAATRQASTSKTTPKPAPKTLGKPEKFNPPSHPSRLVKPSPIRQYGPALTTEEKRIHETKQYPHSPPPKGSFMDRFLNNRGLHMTIALSVLFFFAGWTAVLNFKATSPYAGTMPGLSDWLSHPFKSFSKVWETVKLHELHESEVMQQKRDRAIAETMKTKAYRVMHGLEPLKGQPIEVQILVARMRGTYIEGPAGQPMAPEIEEPPPKRPVKKWLGIW